MADRLASLVHKYRLPHKKLADALTQRQMAFLALRAIGASNPEIAAAYSVTKQHVHNTIHRAVRQLRRAAKANSIPFPAHMSPAMLQRYVIKLGWDDAIAPAANRLDPPRVDEAKHAASLERWRDPL